MMKNNRLLFTVLCSFALLFQATVLQAKEFKEYYVLYGVKIGQRLDHVKRKFGKPGRVVKFQDGWVAYVYQLKGHNVIFETRPNRPDEIVSIQLTGYHNPPNKGLGDINLGDNAKVLQRLGKPAHSKPAIDLRTKQAVPNTFIYYYGKGLSIEVRDNKIFSIKILKPN